MGNGRWPKEKLKAVELREDFVVAMVKARDGMKMTRMVHLAANLKDGQDDHEDKIIWQCTEETWADVSRAFELGEAVANCPYIWPGVESMGEANRLAYHFRSPLLKPEKVG